MKLEKINIGDLCVTLESLRVPTKGNPRGSSVAAFCDDFSEIHAWIEPGTSLVIVECPVGLFVRALCDFGLFWVMKREIALANKIQDSK